MVPGHLYVPWNDLDAIKAATNENTVAVLLEPIQGEGGVNMPGEGYLEGVRAWCTANNVLLIFDEIQTGNGRTGTLFAYQGYGVEPDIMALAKGLAGGVPIGAVLAREDSALHLIPGDHGTTFGANPLATAAGVATYRYILDNDLPAQAARAADRLTARLRSLEDRNPDVTEVRGRGLLIAVGLAKDISADVVVAARERGLMVNNVRPNAVRLMPPLTVTDDELDRACDILEEAIRAVSGAPK
jgi:acetylornithine/succinyldiaminopimelate/putrescine aminotransferase